MKNINLIVFVILYIQTAECIGSHRRWRSS